MNAFRGTLGIRVIQCRPADPEAKGLVERANGYLETSFLPGRRFTSPQDFNVQLAEWMVRANNRRHRVLGCRPVDRWDADRVAMLPLPPVAPVVGWRQTTRLPRDHYVRVDTDPAHRQAAADLRVAAQRTPTPAVDAQVQRRALADSDRMFGLDEVAA